MFRRAIRVKQIFKSSFFCFGLAIFLAFFALVNSVQAQNLAPTSANNLAQNSGVTLSATLSATKKSATTNQAATTPTAPSIDSIDSDDSVDQLVYEEPQQHELTGMVVRIRESGEELVNDKLSPFQILEIELQASDQSETAQLNLPTTIELKNSVSQIGVPSVSFEKYKADDKVKITVIEQQNGSIDFILNGHVKRDGLLSLLVLFIVVVLVVGRVWGALSLVGLVTSFLVIFKLIVPLIVKGYDPVITAVIGSMIIVPTTFYISHGFNTKTHVGVITTFVSLLITGILAAFYVEITHLTGFASEEAGFLQVSRQGSIDIRGLLLAGMIIGTLGILDDVTVGQSSVVAQLKKANPQMDAWQLFKNGMKVGQDHISSMVNTLVLVYSGSALPLLLLFFDSHKTFSSILEYELIAEEIVRMLVGSIGLVIAAPLATIVAALFFARDFNQKSSS